MQEIADWLEKLGMSEYAQREGCHGELDPTPGIREQPRPKPDVATIIQIVSTCTIPKQSRPSAFRASSRFGFPRTKSRAWPFSLLRRPQRMSPEVRLS